MEVTDEGKGIVEEKLSKITSTGLPGVGLRSMRERIKDFDGDMEIISRAKGTHIRVMIPLGAAVRDVGPSEDITL